MKTKTHGIAKNTQNKKQKDLAKPLLTATTATTAATAKTAVIVLAVKILVMATNCFFGTVNTTNLKKKLKFCLVWFKLEVA